MAAIPGLRAAAGRIELDTATLASCTPGEATVAGLLAGRISLAERASWQQRFARDPQAAAAALSGLPRNDEFFEETKSSLHARLADVRAARSAVASPPPAVQVPAPPAPATSLETVTASGLEPAALAAVSNPYAREAIRREPDRGKAFAMAQEYSGEDGALRAAVDQSTGGNAVARVYAEAVTAQKYAADRARQTPPSWGPPSTQRGGA